MSVDIHKFGNIKSRRVFAVDNSVTEQNRQRNESYFTDYKNPKQYIKAKLKMLRNEMFIKPTEEEVEHLYSLKTDVAIDNAVHAIIDRHWG